MFTQEQSRANLHGAQSSSLKAADEGREADGTSALKRGLQAYLWSPSRFGNHRALAAVRIRRPRFFAPTNRSIQRPNSIIGFVVRRDKPA